MKRIMGITGCVGVLAGLFYGGVAGAQVYRWDTGEKISDLPVERGARFDGASLNYADFVGSDLSGAWFGRASLNHADFEGGNLTGVGFYGASLVNANFRNANLRDVSFHDYDDSAALMGADFTGADIRGALVGPSFSPSQLYSTASYEAGDLAGMRFQDMDLAGWRFENQDLDGANFERTQIAGADFTGSLLTHVNLKEAVRRGFSQSQLHSSESYQNGDLSGINLSKNDLTGWNFAGQNLEGANFRESDLSGVDFSGANLRDVDLDQTLLTDTNLTDAIIAGVKFKSNTGAFWPGAEPVSRSQFYSTASYQQGDISGVHLIKYDLTGWDLSGQSLRNADVRKSILVDVNLTGADIRGTNLSQTTALGFSSTQLYSTASYQQRDLVGLFLKKNDMRGWNLSGQKMTGANLSHADLTGADLSTMDLGQGFAERTNFTNADLRGARLVDVDMESSNLTGADLTGADVRGAKWLFADNLASAGQVRNLIRQDGSIQGGVDVRAGEVFSIRDYDTERLRIDVEDDFTVADGGTLSFIFDDERWGSRLMFEEGANITLEGTIELILDESSLTDLGVGMGFHLFDWRGVTPEGEFEVSIPQSGVEFDLSDLYTTGGITLTAAPWPVVQDWEPSYDGILHGGGSAFTDGELEELLKDELTPPGADDPSGEALGDQLTELYGPVAADLDAFTRGIARLEGETITAYFARLGHLPPTAPAPPVPEPSTLALLVGASLKGLRRARRT